MHWDEDKLIQRRDQHEDWLMQQPFISGTGIGFDDSGQLCIKVFTDHATNDQRDLVLQRLGDAPVDFEEAGPIDALES